MYTYLKYTSVQCLWLQSHVEMLSQQRKSGRDILGSPRKKPCLRPKVLRITQPGYLQVP